MLIRDNQNILRSCGKRERYVLLRTKRDQKRAFYPLSGVLLKTESLQSLQNVKAR